jgi:hypothetical protein
MLAAAERGASRRELLAECARAWGRRGVYGGGRDELTRPLDDPLSLLPAAFLAARLLLNPGSARRMIGGTVDNYALSEEAVGRIRGLGSC